MMQKMKMIYENRIDMHIYLTISVCEPTKFKANCCEVGRDSNGKYF